jgi:hypothetical protein
VWYIPGGAYMVIQIVPISSNDAIDWDGRDIYHS